MGPVYGTHPIWGGEGGGGRAWCIYIINIIQLYIYMAMSQNCVWNVPRCSGRMERRGFVTGLVPDVWNVMKYKLYIKINMYTVYMYNILYIIYISRICTLKLLPLAAAHFHFSSARHPCCTPVQRRFALHG